MRTRSFVALGALLTCSLVGSSAFANGRFPAAGQLVFNPSDPSLMAVRATFGVMISRDSGKTWDWICEKAMGYGDSIEDPSIALTAGPGLLVGTQEGLAQSADGCGWSFFPALGAPVVDLVVKANDPKGAIALVSVSGKVDDAGNATFVNQLYATSDSGAHWTALGAPIDPLLIVETVEVAKSDAQRLYVSGTSYRSDGADAVILVSKDGGLHFDRHTFPLAAKETAPFISAVDPTKADRVYIRVQGKPGSRLVVSDDGAVTFNDKFTTTGPMLGFALSEDGSKVYLGSIEDGMYAASSADLKFTQKSATQIQCLKVQSGKLYACSNENSGFALGTSTDDGASFTPLFHLGCLRGAIACDADAAAAVCGDLFPNVQPTLGACVPPGADAGKDAEAPGDDGGVSTKDSGTPGQGHDAGSSGNGDDGGGGSSGCTTSPGGASTVGAGFGLAFALLALARRRKRD